MCHGTLRQKEASDSWLNQRLQPSYSGIKDWCLLVSDSGTPTQKVFFCKFTERPSKTNLFRREGSLTSACVSVQLKTDRVRALPQELNNLVTMCRGIFSHIGGQDCDIDHHQHHPNHDEDHLLMGKGGELDPVGSQQFVAGLKPTVGEGGLFHKGLQGGDWWSSLMIVVLMIIEWSPLWSNHIWYSSNWIAQGRWRAAYLQAARSASPSVPPICRFKILPTQSILSIFILCILR